VEPQAGAAGVLRAAVEFAATDDPTRAAPHPPAAHGAARAESDVGARLHDGDAL
jgi:hypothetical protein